MQVIFKDKNPSVIAGLVAALGVSAVLVVPNAALADEVAAVAANENAAVVSTEATVSNTTDELSVLDEVSFDDEESVVPEASAEDTAAGGSNDVVTPSDEAADSDAASDAGVTDGTSDAEDKVISGETETAASPDAADAKTGEASGLDSATPVQEATAETATLASNASSTKAESYWDGEHYFYYDEKTKTFDSTRTDYVVDTHLDGKSLERYWIESGWLFKGGLFTDNSGNKGYSKSNGVVVRGGYKDSDGNVYYADNDGKLIESGWVVTADVTGGLERYWFDDYKAARNQLVNTGSSYSYAKDDATIVRGRYSVGRKVYLADNDGKLAGGTKGGWVVSSAYGQGLQRYWIDPDAHCAIAGYDDGTTAPELGNYAHFTTEEGYVLRGVSRLSKYVYLADNDGRLARGGNSDGSGWLVTTAYGQGLQRYWIMYGGWAEVGFSEDGYAHYTTENGYVLRGALKDSSGDIYYADNDGKLQKSGWLVTADITGGLERFWLEDYKAARDQLINTGSGYAYAKDNGIILRGRYSVGRKVYLADNDGNLAGGTKGGWVVSSAYGQGLQRYWVDPDKHIVIAGYDDASAHTELGNYAHFTTEEGYVLRGVQYLKDAGRVYLGDNDGRLARGEGADGVGWLVTSAYGQGLQRYWIMYGGWAEVGFSEDGYAHYTTENGYVLRGGMKDSNGDIYYADNNGKLQKSGWLVTADITGGLERYWLNDYKAVKNSFVNTGSSWSYCTSDGTVLRGTGKVGGKIYLANNDGKLATAGWLVADYGKGTQRYYLTAVSGTGYGYATTSFFQASLLQYVNAWFYGDTSYGYVWRGKNTVSGKGMLISNNEGVLAESLDSSVKSGMVVTNKLGDGLQRYYFVQDDGHYYAKVGVFADGNNHYFGNESTGYLVRGKMKYGSGMLVADNEGKLLWGNNNSWAVTAAFDGGAQRYYVVKIGQDSSGNAVYGAKLGLFTVGKDDYYGRDDEGYVVRGTWTAPDGMVYYADNDGKLDLYREIRNRIWSWSSGTQYLIVLDSATYRVYVFEGSAYNWKAKYAWACGVWMAGYGPSMHHQDAYGWYNDYTVGGDDACYNYTRWKNGTNNFKGGYRAEYYPEDDIKYFTGICLDLGFHSTIGWEGGYSDVNQLNRNISHGCVRLLEANAKWIYDNCGVGTRVRFA